MAMIFQDPLSSLNPYYTVGLQIAEAYLAHRGGSRRHAHKVAVEAMELAWLLVGSKAMRGLAKHMFPQERTFRNRKTISEWIWRSCDSGYHPCGTVPMGEATDARGRVLGVDGLYVADVSLTPTIPMANTNLTALMMGERFGEWLREGD